MQTSQTKVLGNPLGVVPLNFKLSGNTFALLFILEFMKFDLSVYFGSSMVVCVCVVCCGIEESVKV